MRRTCRRCRRCKRESERVEIDYDALAKALIKAQKQFEIQDTTHGKARSIFMRICNVIIYISVYLFAVICCYFMWNVETQNTEELILKIALFLLFAILAIFMFLAEIESFKDTKNEAQKHFNTNLSFVSLIIALIALVGGMG